MKRLIVVALGVFVALSAAAPASATTNTSTVVGALQKAPVYIAQGTEGTDSGTATTLEEKLRDDDNIVLAMLPDNSKLTQENVDALAKKISNGLKGKRIVGIAVGTQFAGAATILPSGTAADLMERASTVSTNSVETLVTFVRNVHDWQQANPQPTPVSKPAKGNDSGFALLIVIGVLVTLIIAVFTFLHNRRIRTRVHYTAPGGLNDPIKAMMRLREHLSSNDGMYSAIDTLCRYTEAYFKRFTSEKKSSSTVMAFNNQLELAQKVVEAYVDVRENPQYYYDPSGVMKRGADSIKGLADTVLASIKKGNADRLMDYNVSTNILDAQRYKNPPTFH